MVKKKKNVNLYNKFIVQINCKLKFTIYNYHLKHNSWTAYKNSMLIWFSFFVDCPYSRKWHQCLYVVLCKIWQSWFYVTTCYFYSVYRIPYRVTFSNSMCENWSKKLIWILLICSHSGCMYSIMDGCCEFATNRNLQIIHKLFVTWGVFISFPIHELKGLLHTLQITLYTCIHLMPVFW